MSRVSVGALWKKVCGAGWGAHEFGPCSAGCEASWSRRSGGAEDRDAAGHRGQTWRQSGLEVYIWMSWACLLFAFVSCTVFTCLNKGKLTMIKTTGRDLNQNLLSPNGNSKCADIFRVQGSILEAEGVKECRIDTGVGKTSKRKSKYKRGRWRAEYMRACGNC